MLHIADERLYYYCTEWGVVIITPYFNILNYSRVCFSPWILGAIYPRNEYTASAKRIEESTPQLLVHKNYSCQTHIFGGWKLIKARSFFLCLQSDLEIRNIIDSRHARIFNAAHQAHHALFRGFEKRERSSSDFENQLSSLFSASACASWLTLICSSFLVKSPNQIAELREHGAELAQFSV